MTAWVSTIPSVTRARAAGGTKGLVGGVIDDKVEGLAADDDWGKRRTSIRHEVKLHAIIFDRRALPLPCTIEDISATGMALRLDTGAGEPGRDALEQGTSAKIEFAPRPEDPDAPRFLIPVQVMWRTPVGAGVRFRKVDDVLRAALREVAEAAVKRRVAAAPVHKHSMAIQQRKVMLACRKTIERLLPNMIWTLRAETVRKLRQFADTASPHDARELRAEAALIDEKANAIGRTIERLFLQEFAETSDLDQTQEMTVAPMFLRKTPDAKAAPVPVSVVDEQVVDQDATLIAIAHSATERFKLKLFQLNIRFANVLGHPVDNSSNPLQPMNGCRIFWQATVEYCNSVAVRRSLYDTIRTRIVPLLGELYEAIDKTLDDEGVPRAFDNMN